MENPVVSGVMPGSEPHPGGGVRVGGGVVDEQGGGGGNGIARGQDPVDGGIWLHGFFPGRYHCAVQKIQKRETRAGEGKGRLRIIGEGVELFPKGFQLLQELLQL